MGKMYTLDGKMLVDTPEIRIGDKVYPVDNRVKTVKKMETIPTDDESAIFTLALGEKAAAEIDEMELPFPAYKELLVIVIAAMTGEEVDDVKARFRTAGGL